MLGCSTISDTGEKSCLMCLLDWGHTRVVCRTLARRGKSLTPESRIEMLDESRVLLERREETQDASALAMI